MRQQHVILSACFSRLVVDALYPAAGGGWRFGPFGRAAYLSSLAVLDEPLEGLAAIIAGERAHQILPITDRAVILKHGRVVHAAAGAAFPASPGTAERHLGLSGV